MKKFTLIGLLFLTGISVSQPANQPARSASQNHKVFAISFNAGQWEFKPQTVEFLAYKSRPAMKLTSSGDPVILKNFSFTNGTIEYDMEPLDPRFASFYFRLVDSKENECFYFRTGRAGDTQAVDAVQYTPLLDGVSLWDMLFHFQTNADFKKGDWNHVKLVISGKQMRAYVNDVAHPVLEVPMLEGNTATGTLAFEGQAVISNLVIKSDSVEGLSRTGNRSHRWRSAVPSKMESQRTDSNRA